MCMRRIWREFQKEKTKTTARWWARKEKVHIKNLPFKCYCCVCQSGAQSESSRRQLGLRVRGVEFFSWPLGPCWPLIQPCYWSEELCDTVTTTHPRQQPHRRSGMLEERERERCWVSVYGVKWKCQKLIHQWLSQAEHWSMEVRGEDRHRAKLLY